MIKYTTKEGMFETNNPQDVPIKDLHSLNDNPALILDTIYRFNEQLYHEGEFWFFEGKIHRDNDIAYKSLGKKR